MLTIRRPTPDRLRTFTEGLGSHALSYTGGLLDRLDSTPELPGGVDAWLGDGWFVDRHAEEVGIGRDDFDAACDALRAWAMFDQSWTEPVDPPAPIDVGIDVGYTARVFGLWWTYGCRILDVIDEPGRFGFVYGTVGDHATRGEELFQVELDADGVVEFSLVAMSRPGRWFAWPGLPIARLTQRRFRPGAAEGIRRFVADRGTETPIDGQ